MGESKARILVVDDDGDILDLLKYNFQKEGFRVKTIDDSSRTVKVAMKFSPDLIILDVMMPKPDGLEICEQLRSIPSFSDTYIFFLTARPGNVFQSTALRSGGDDYIEKLMGLRSLLYKVKSVLKQNIVIQKRVAEIHTGQLHLLRSTQEVIFRNTKVAVDAVEFEMLFFFAQNSGRIITTDMLVHSISGTEIELQENSVEVYIAGLTRKLSPDMIRRLDKRKFRFGR
ncbi:MAG TPA: response regulator transcription factor [Ohtaekwangia sp.]|nr:response regulator transcription factor [Ohtaekwangia sp.]